MIRVNRNVYHMSPESLDKLIGKTPHDFLYDGNTPIWIVEVVEVDKSIKVEYVYMSTLKNQLVMTNEHTKPLIERFRNLTSKNNTVDSSRGVASKLCDCGAIHTSFPNNHYNWCSVRR